MQQPLVQARPSLVLTCVVVLLGAVITAAGTSAGGVPRLTAPTSGHETSSTTDPWFQEAPKIAPSDEVGAGQFGTSVALSADGSTALIGGPDDNAGPGAAWVFVRTASGWSEEAKLVPNDEGGDGKFGSAVAMSADGNTALVGAPSDETGNAMLGGRVDVSVTSLNGTSERTSADLFAYMVAAKPTTTSSTTTVRSGANPDARQPARRVGHTGGGRRSREGPPTGDHAPCLRGRSFAGRAPGRKVEGVLSDILSSERSEQPRSSSPAWHTQGH